MPLNFKYLTHVCCIALTLSSTVVSAGGLPPWLENLLCRFSWQQTPISTNLAFGAFSIESGAGTIRMSSSGVLTSTGAINLSSSLPVNTYQIQITNTRGQACVDMGFTISWNPAPQPLAGPGANLPLTVFVYEPTIAPSAGATLPITVPANSGITTPFTLTLYGDISTSFAQTSGLYSSPNFRTRVELRNSPNITATATSIAPISLLEIVPMDFGTIAGSSSASSVILNTAGGRSATGGAQLLVTGPGSAATFQVTGDPNLSYGVSFSASGTLENPGGQQITVTSFTHNASGIIPAGGTENFQVGGRLNLNPSQPKGVYTTTTGAGSPYSMTVNYN